jgi:hypothetical protein
MNQQSNRFVIKKNSIVVIYGASFVGKTFYNALKTQGIETIIFLDMNAPVLGDIGGVPIYIPDAAPILDTQKNDVIVIVAVTNVKEHPFIANYLLNAGYKNILYKFGINDFPQPSDLIYDGILNGTLQIGDGIEVKGSNIPKFWTDRSYLRELGKDRLLVLIPIELLFISRQKDTEIPSEMGISLENRPLIGAVPLLNAYDYFEGKNTDSFELFIQRLSTSRDSHRDSVGWMRWLEERRNESRTFALEVELDNCYFEKNPVEVEWSSRGLFFVLSRYRMAVYQVARNRKLIPCSVSRDEYSEWRNEPEISPCIESLKKHSLSYVYTPILHPNFIDYPCMRENYGMTRLMTLCKYIYENSIELTGKKVLDAGSYLSYFAQNFSRMGANVTSVEFDSAKYEPACAINKMLRQDDVVMIENGIEELSPNNRYSITIMTAVLNWHLDSELGKKIINIINLVTEDYLIWESGYAIEREKQFILDNSSFKKYTRLQSTFGTGKLRELGVFSK